MSTLGSERDKKASAERAAALGVRTARLPIAASNVRESEIQRERARERARERERERERESARVCEREREGGGVVTYARGIPVFPS